MINRDYALVASFVNEYSDWLGVLDLDLDLDQAFGIEFALNRGKMRFGGCSEVEHLMERAFRDRSIASLDSSMALGKSRMHLYACSTYS